MFCFSKFQLHRSKRQPFDAVRKLLDDGTPIEKTALQVCETTALR